MRRYIDADEVEKRIDVVIGSEPKGWDKKALRELKMYVVHAVPTVDAVEVVRCKDCKHYDGEKCLRYEPTKWKFYVVPDDFCSYGERKDE